MQPVLFRLPEALPIVGGVPINSFGVMLYLAFVAGGLLWQRELERKGLGGDRAWDLVLWALVGGLVGAKLYWAFWNFDLLASDPIGTLFSGAGLTWYGGFLLGALAVWLGIRRMELPPGPTLDAVAPAMPLAVAIGRVGCFLAGDDYGRPTDSAVGVAFPEGFPPTRVDVLEQRFGYTVDPALVERFGAVVPVHPTQLYEAGISLLVFAVVFSLRRHPNRAGWLFALWLALYAAQRFFIEVFRIKDDRILFGTFTIAQLLSVVLAAGAVYALVRFGSARREAPSGAPTG